MIGGNASTNQAVRDWQTVENVDGNIIAPQFLGSFCRVVAGWPRTDDCNVLHASPHDPFIATICSRFPPLAQAKIAPESFASAIHEKNREFGRVFANWVARAIRESSGARSFAGRAGRPGRAGPGVA